MIASVREHQMPCERCEELELRHLNRTEEYIGLVERQSRLFRDGEAQAGREMDPAITEAKAARTAALRELDEHQVSHQSLLQGRLTVFLGPVSEDYRNSGHPALESSLPYRAASVNDVFSGCGVRKFVFESKG